MFLRILLIAILFISINGPLQALMVLHNNLQSMVNGADRILLGKVLTVKEGTDPAGRSCQFITFEVSECFKGDCGKTLTIKQVHSRPFTRSDGIVVQSTLFRGVPVFKEGKTGLFLLSPNSKIGFTTTVGFGQGKFDVLIDEFGQKKLVNGVGNWRLFQGMQVLPGYKSQGLTTKRFQALQASPKDLYLDQMRTILQTLIPKPIQE